MSKTNTSNPRPKPAKENAKTSLCKAFAATGECKFGDQCTYAHGAEELRRKQRSKIDKPCWWFNKGGCSKSDADCIYQHVIDPSLRKPIHLQHPCVWMHLRSTGSCRNGRSCGGDHDYELTAEEWKHHYPTAQFPGEGYLRNNVHRGPTPRQRPSVRTQSYIPGRAVPRPSPAPSVLDDEDEFPTLASPIKAAKPHPVWEEPLPVIKDAPPSPQPTLPEHHVQAIVWHDEQRADEPIDDSLDDASSRDELDDIVNGRFNPDAPSFIPSRPLNPEAPLFTPLEQQHLKAMVNNALQQLLRNDVFA